MAVQSLSLILVVMDLKLILKSLSAISVIQNLAKKIDLDIYYGK